MTGGLGSCCDDFYVNMRLVSQMPLVGGRETLLHFFERMQREFPGMCRFRRAENGDCNIEEERVDQSYRWATLESKRLSCGHVNPSGVAEAVRLHKSVLELAPHYLGISTLEIDHLDVLLGFDLAYMGNHDEVVAEAMFAESPLLCLSGEAGARAVDFQPSVTVALSEDCRMQGRIDVVTRTNTHQVRTGEYGNDVISVYLIVRRYFGDRVTEPMEVLVEQMAERAEDLATRYVIPRVIRPISAAIASRS